MANVVRDPEAAMHNFALAHNRVRETMQLAVRVADTTLLENARREILKLYEVIEYVSNLCNDVCERLRI